MIIRTPALWPVKQPFRLLDRKIIDRCISVVHDALTIELPVFVAIGTIPLTGVVTPFIGKANSNSAFRKRPKFLYQAILQLTTPFPFEEGDYLLASMDEFRAVSPVTVLRVCKGDLLGITCVPAVFSLADLSERRLVGKRGNQLLSHNVISFS